jgi:hypothetical protein
MVVMVASRCLQEITISRLPASFNCVQPRHGIGAAMACIAASVARQRGHQPAGWPPARRRGRLMRALLDVAVLIALLDSDHLHHARAGACRKENIKSG